MGVYKEGYYIVNQLQQKSVQIFNDACDHGAPTKLNDSIWNSAKQLADDYGIKSSRKHYKYNSGESVEIQIQLGSDDSDRPCTNKYLLLFVTCKSGKCKGFNGYVSIVKIP